MKKNVTLAILSAAVIGLGPFIVSCDNVTDPAADKIDGAVGIVFPNDYLRWDNDEARFRAALTAAGVEHTILRSADSSVTEATHVANLIESGIKVLVLCPVSSADAASAAEAAHAAGVTVIAYERLITETAAVDYYVSFKSLDVGRMQGQYLIDHATGTGNPLYLYAGNQTDNNSFLFFAGSWSVLQPKIADGTFVIANSQAADGLKESATLTHDQISTIFGTNAISGTPPAMTVDGITTHS